MRISQLADRSGVPLATVKFYLREGLLHPGVSTAATRASYDETHLRRLRLIRALVDVGGLGLQQVHQVLAALNDPQRSLHDALGSAHVLLAEGPQPPAQSREDVDQLLRRWRWRIAPDSPNRDVLARAITAARAVGLEVDEQRLASYGQAMRGVARADVAGVATGDREDAAARVVLGTLLLEPVLLALRRLAHEDVSARRFKTASARRRRAPG